MSEKNLIHVRLDYEEVLRSKRSILSLEMNLLNVIKIIRRYYSLRLTELKLKTELEKKIRNFSSKMRSLQTTLPKPVSATASKISKEKKEIIERKITYDESLESQLKEIQEKLKSLGVS